MIFPTNGIATKKGEGKPRIGTSFGNNFMKNWVKVESFKILPLKRYWKRCVSLQEGIQQRVMQEWFPKYQLKGKINSF